MSPTATGQHVPNPRSTVRKEGRMGYTTKVYPRVYGGVCEHCGILDPNVDSQDQYKLCEHYRGLSLECNYCDPMKDPREVTRVARLYVYDHPTRRDPSGRPELAVVCDSFTCSNAFNTEFGK